MNWTVVKDPGRPTYRVVSGPYAVLGSFHRSMALEIADRLNTGKGKLNLSIVKVHDLCTFSAAFASFPEGIHLA